MRNERIANAINDCRELLINELKGVFRTDTGDFCEGCPIDINIRNAVVDDFDGSVLSESFHSIYMTDGELFVSTNYEDLPIEMFSLDEIIKIIDEI